MQVQTEVSSCGSGKGDGLRAPTRVTAVDRLQHCHVSPVLTVVARFQAPQRRQVLPPHTIVFLLHRSWYIHAAWLRAVSSIYLIRQTSHRHAPSHVSHDDLRTIIHCDVAVGLHRIALPTRLRNRKSQHSHRSVKLLLRHGSLQSSVEARAATNHRIAAHQHLHPQFFRYPRTTSAIAIGEVGLELQTHSSCFLCGKDKHFPPLG